MAPADLHMVAASPREASVGPEVPAFVPAASSHQDLLLAGVTNGGRDQITKTSTASYEHSPPLAAPVIGRWLDENF